MKCQFRLLRTERENMRPARHELSSLIAPLASLHVPNLHNGSLSTREAAERTSRAVRETRTLHMAGTSVLPAVGRHSHQHYNKDQLPVSDHPVFTQHHAATGNHRTEHHLSEELSAWAEDSSISGRDSEHDVPRRHLADVRVNRRSLPPEDSSDSDTEEHAPFHPIHFSTRSPSTTPASERKRVVGTPQPRGPNTSHESSVRGAFSHSEAEVLRAVWDGNSGVGGLSAILCTPSKSASCGYEGTARGPVDSDWARKRLSSRSHVSLDASQLLPEVMCVCIRVCAVAPVRVHLVTYSARVCTRD